MLNILAYVSAISLILLGIKELPEMIEFGKEELVEYKLIWKDFRRIFYGK